MSVKKIFLIAILATVPAGLLAQAPQAKGPKQTAASAASVGPEAISGQASSGRNCIGPSGSNVHPIGWVPSGSRVQVQGFLRPTAIVPPRIFRIGARFLF